jgi:hypothetical protein
MRTILTTALLACLALTGCFGSSAAPLDVGSVRSAIAAQIDRLRTGIEREDPLLASQIVSDRFVMNPNIGIRYLDDGWPDNGVGISAFRGFFADVFELHANIDQSFELRDVQLVGSVASARVYNQFFSSRTDRVPPEGYTASGWDWLIFELQGASWVLIRWDEAPAPHDMGEGETL